MTQAGCANSNNWDQCFAPVFKTLEGVFEDVVPYRSNVPSFVSCWGFVMARKGGDGVGLVDAEEVDRRIEEAKPAFKEGKDYEHFDGVAWVAMRSLEKVIRKGLMEETRVITEENPVYMF